MYYRKNLKLIMSQLLIKMYFVYTLYLLLHFCIHTHKIYYIF